VLGELWGFPPALGLEGEAAVQKTIIELIGAGLVDSAHDCSEGGLAVALARCSFPKGIGCDIDLHSQELAPEFVLFGEDASRIVISCDPANLVRIKEVAAKTGIAAEKLGETGSSNLEIKIDGRVVITASIAELCDVYENALEGALRSDPAPVAAD
jgi:phosphoribosylformylglycinamidine synthase